MKNPSFKLSVLVIFVFALNQIITAQYVLPVRTAVFPATSGDITIDGVADEPSYGANETMSPPFNTTDWDNEADLSGYFRACWDYTHLYFFAEVTDEKMHGWDGENGNWWEFDNVILYFNIDSSQSEGWDYLDDAVHFSFHPLLNDSILTYDERSDLAEADVEIVHGPASWSLEAAIPWVWFLPGPAEAIEPDDIMQWIDKYMGFDVMFSDSDGDDPYFGERTAMAAWDSDLPDTPGDWTEDNAWNNTSVFGIISLVGEGVVLPVAEAGPYQEVDEGTLVTLDGSGSYDPEAAELTYTWSTPEGIVLSDIHAVSPSFTAPEVVTHTNYAIGLVVNNGDVNSSIDYVTIRVLNTDFVPVADAGTDQTVNERELVMLDGNGSSDPNFNTIYYSWTSPDNVKMIGATTANPMLIAPDVFEDTVFAFLLTVDDGDYFSEPDTVNLYVNSLNDRYDTLYVVDTDTIFNTIVISATDKDGKLIAHEIDGAMHITLYPNPADQLVYISSEMTIHEVAVYDELGTEVLLITVNDLEAEIDLGPFVAGNYILRITTDSGIITKKLVLK